MKINFLLTLFQSLCTECISMFPPLIWKKINEIQKSHAYHIHLAYKTVGLSSCRTSDRIPIKCVALHLFNLNPLYPKILGAKFDWNWSSGSGKMMKMWKIYRRTIEEQTVRQTTENKRSEAHELSAQVRKKLTIMCNTFQSADFFYFLHNRSGEPWQPRVTGNSRRHCKAQL